MKTRLVVLLAVAMLALSQLACGSFSNESRTIDSVQKYVDQKILPAQGGW